MVLTHNLQQPDELMISSLVAQRLKRLPPMRETQVRSLSREDPLERKWQPTPVFLPGKFHGQRSLVGYSPWGHKESDTTGLNSLKVLRGFPGGSDGKASACNAGDPGLIPGWGRSPGEGNGNLLQYSCLENSMDRGAL